MSEQFTPRFSFVDLHLDAVALCAQGANSRADILLTKSMKEGNSTMKIEDIIAGLSSDAQEVLTKHIAAEVAKAVEPLNTKIATLTADNENLKKSATQPAAEPAVSEDIMKTLPADVRAQFAAMEKSIKALENEKAENLAKSRFDIVKAIPCEEATLKSVLKTATPEVFDILTKAAAAIEQGLGKSTAASGEGTIAASADEAYSALEKHATAIAKSENVTPAVAFTKACEQYPDLYAQYVKGE